MDSITIVSTRTATNNFTLFSFVMIFPPCGTTTTPIYYKYNIIVYTYKQAQIKRILKKEW